MCQLFFVFLELLDKQPDNKTKLDFSPALIHPSALSQGQEENYSKTSSILFLVIGFQEKSREEVLVT